MSKALYTKPSPISKYISRIKRNVPPIMVDTYDNGFSIFHRKTEIPYHLSEESEGIFFIVGCGRSGNTLLRNTLCEKYKVCIPPEIPGLGNTIRSFSRKRHEGWESSIDQVLSTFKNNANVDVYYPGKEKAYNLDAELLIDYDLVREKLIGIPEVNQSLSSILYAIYGDYRRKNYDEGDLLGDKTPWNAFHLTRLNKTFPEAKYIHMIRDSRAVCASYVKSLGELTGITIRESAFRWKDAVKKCMKFEKINSENVIRIRYEDLVSDPDSTITTVANFLQLEKRNNFGPKRFGDEVLPHYEKSFRPIAQDSIAKWRENLTDQDVSQIVKVTGKIMRKVGYDV